MINKDDVRLRKLIGNDKSAPWNLSKSKKSIESELEFYQFKGSKTKSVRNRIDRLTEALDILVKDEEKLKC